MAKKLTCNLVRKFSLALSFCAGSLVLGGCSAPESSFDNQVVVAASPKQVWKAFNDPQQLKTWSRWLRLPEQMLQQGQNFKLGFELPEQVISYDAEVFKMVGPEELTFKFEPFSLTDVFYQIKIVPLPDGSSQVLQSYRYQGRGLWFNDPTDVSSKLQQLSQELKVFVEDEAYFSCLDNKYQSYLNAKINWIDEKTRLTSKVLPNYQDLIDLNKEVELREIKKLKMAFAWIRVNNPQRIHADQPFKKWLNIGPFENAQISASSEEYTKLLEMIKEDTKRPSPLRGAWMIRDERDKVWPLPEFKRIKSSYRGALMASERIACKPPEHMDMEAKSTKASYSG